MAMVKCKECKQDVSNWADKCPHCGVKNPATGPKEMVVAVVILLFVGWMLFSLLLGDDSEDSTATEPTKTPEQIAAELTACKQSLQCWGDKHIVEAGIQCDEYVERLANYQFEWTDGFLEPKFSHFQWLNIDKGQLTYIGDKIKFQNSFGAWANIIYECDFDPVNNIVLSVRGDQGQL